MIELEALAAPVSPELPCGPNLEYDPDFLALEEAARGRPEQQSGDAIVPAKEPEWADVRQRAEALLHRTKDLRSAVLLCRALTRTDGFPGLHAGLNLIYQLLSRYWENVYPLIEAEDGDPTMRLNALAPLIDPEALLRDVRNLNVVTSAGTRVSLRDLLVMQQKLQPVGQVAAVNLQAIEGMIRETASSSPPPMESVQQALRVLDAFETLLAAKVGSARGVSLSVIRESLAGVIAVWQSALGTQPTPPLGVAGASDNGSSARVVHEIRHRDDAVRQLERVCEFIQATEPGNPAPLLIRRAQRLMSKSFIDIIQDLAPESLAQIQKLAGLEKK